MTDLIPSLVAARHDELVDIRRQIHAHPELAHEEHATSALLLDRLVAAGASPRRCPTRSGAVAVLDSGRAGPTVLLRTDLDALSIDEPADAAGASFASQMPGHMHACGHDVHVAVLAGVVSVLAELDNWSGRIVAVGQPAEELAGGADAMLAAGLLDPERGGVALDPARDSVHGVHVTSLLPVGVVGIREGIAWAGADVLRVDVRGTGGHGAMAPGGSVIAAVVELIPLIESVAQNLEMDGTPAVCSVASIDAGRASNVIPESATVLATLRTFDEPQQAQALARLRRVLADSDERRGTHTRLGVFAAASPLVNDPESSQLAAKACAEVVGIGPVIPLPPVTASDDIAAFLRRCPGAYLTIGAALPDLADGVVRHHHSPGFAVDEAVLPVAVESLLRVTLAALGRPRRSTADEVPQNGGTR
ncbi:MAG: M20 metallopeptidase family protein [Dermatophilaceae bacterium]